MSYYSNLDIRLQELGFVHHTKDYYTMGLWLEVNDCTSHRGVDCCKAECRKWPCGLVERLRGER